MMIPASAGWQPEAASTSGVVAEGQAQPVVFSDLAAGVLLPLLGVGALIAAAYMMESSRAEVDDDEDDDLEVEIDEDDEDDEDEDDDYDDDYDDGELE